jgi:transcriptional regulator with XRE-family HTH domain
MGTLIRADWLRRALALRGMTGEDLARESRRTPSTISHALNGRAVSNGTISAIARALARVHPIPGAEDLVA